MFGRFLVSKFVFECVFIFEFQFFVLSFEVLFFGL